MKSNLTANHRPVYCYIALFSFTGMDPALPGIRACRVSDV
jgi:hypothetical protein